MANKIKYGIKSCYYAPITAFATTGAPTYGSPVAMPGAVSLSLAAQGEQTQFYADNIVYWAGDSNSGYQGDLELAKIPDSFKTDILGFIADGNGVLVEDAGAESKHFALLFQFEGDEKATRHVMYNCIASRPDTASQTKEASITPVTESVTITATPVFNVTLNTDIVKAETNSETQTTAYNSFFTTVYAPTAPSATT